jgi:hypothetical protein
VAEGEVPQRKSGVQVSRPERLAGHPVLPADAAWVVQAASSAWNRGLASVRGVKVPTAVRIADIASHVRGSQLKNRIASNTPAKPQPATTSTSYQ